jgi:hypothetical protein
MQYKSAKFRTIALTQDLGPSAGWTARYGILESEGLEDCTPNVLSEKKKPNEPA